MAGLIDYASSVAGEAKKNVQGLLADPKQALKDILNNLALKAAAQQAATKAAWATRDPKIMAQNALDSSQTALGFAPLGITAWHGSPHKFNKFSMDKIGTGEGAQAYGHGMYLAEAPEVALEYQKKLSSTGGAKNLSAQYGGVDSGIAEATRRIDHYNKLIANGGGGDMRRAKGMLSLAQKNLEDLSAIKAGLPENTGQLYKTDIPEEAVARFLDWDKPLSQHSEEVRNLIAQRGPLDDPRTFGFKNPEKVKGADIYNILARGSQAKPGIGEAGVSEAMRQAGIPGIRYLDEGSRNTTQRYIAKHPMGGESVFNTQPELDAFIKRNPEFKAINPNLTSNYVVFDPEMIRILERNGQATGAVPWQPGEWRGLLGNN